MNCHVRDKKDANHVRHREENAEQPTVKKQRTMETVFGPTQADSAAHGDAADGAAATEKHGSSVAAKEGTSGGCMFGFVNSAYATATKLFQPPEPPTDRTEEPKSEIITSTARTAFANPTAPPRDRTRVNHEHGRQMLSTQESNATHHVRQIEVQLAKQQEINERLQQQLFDARNQIDEMRAVSVCIHVFAYSHAHPY